VKGDMNLHGSAVCHDTRSKCIGTNVIHRGRK
jgi:hypothetical protein